MHGEEQRPWSIKFELTSDQDVQFLYVCTVAAENYMQVQLDNQLSVDFDGFISMVKTLLQDCVSNPHLY